MNEDGYFRKVESKEVNGKHFTELNEWVIKDLNSRKISLKETEIVHSYPHDWRDKKPLVYRLTKQWFIDLKKIRKEISENSKIVQWFPSWTEDKMESFIKNRQDWCISRQRCWGLPLPVLYKNKDEEILNAELIDYIADIIEVWGSGRWFNGEILKDIKKKFPEISNKGNISLSKEIMDVWFDSGVSHWCILEKKIIRRD
jgi:isoleucyl-tRNA synthetase